MAYVYLHLKNTDNSVFYVGIGGNDSDNFNRAYSKKRSLYWKNVFNKHGVKVLIVAKNVSIADAFFYEKFFISSYGRSDLGLGNLVNFTDGGEGVSGYKHTELALIKLKINSSGNNNPNTKKCISFDDGKEFCSLSCACNFYNLSYKKRE